MTVIINRDNVTTVMLTNLANLSSAGAFLLYREYVKWLNVRDITRYPSYTRSASGMPEYINFPSQEDALAFKLAFGL